MKQQKTETRGAKLIEKIETIEMMDLVCFSHLRWNFVWQRPQHLMSRFAQERRVFYVEEPIVGDGSTRMDVQQHESGVWVAIPYLCDQLTKEKAREAHRLLIDQLLAEHSLHQFISWYYTPMAMDYTRHLKPCQVVYDCMDELSAFKNSPPRLKDNEDELMKLADLVFTGGQSLWEAKRDRHPRVYAFPSSIEVHHFAQARRPLSDPSDQAGISHPRLGFFGVIDERMDLGLLDAIASSRPQWNLVLIGPTAKVNPKNLPQRSNIHYLGMKDYKDLPAYLAGWDVALLPFQMNEATRFISPTKTPEYLAGGKPVVSTPVRDVVRPYGDLGLVWVADNAAGFIRSIESALKMNGQREHWLKQVDEYLAQNSWDRTWMDMKAKMESTSYKSYSPSAVDISGIEAVGDQDISAPPMPLELERPVRRGGGKVAFDYLVVGAGFAGSVLAERLAVGSGKKVLLIDCRPHIGGNAYDEYNEHGVLIHRYGPHIFHTNSREVFTYLSRFTKWRPYEHRVRASVDGQLVPMPINLDTVNAIYGLGLNSFELEKFFESVAETKEVIETSEDVVVSKIGRSLYEKFFRNYTRKQWDLDPSELDASVTSRVPIRLNRDDRYFTDMYQAMPLRGYTRMFENMLDHPNIKIMLNTDFREIVDYVSYKEMIFTGPVDEYFNFAYGKLPYRSLQFRFETLDKEYHQPVAVLNFPNEHPYTRVTEFKHLTGQEHNKTTLVYEYPCSQGDPYYPIPRSENAELYRKYKALADATSGVHFAGRLATYKYYNMDQVTAQALSLYAKIAGVSRNGSATTYTSGPFSIEIPCTLLAPQGVE